MSFHGKAAARMRFDASRHTHVIIFPVNGDAPKAVHVIQAKENIRAGCDAADPVTQEQARAAGLTAEHFEVARVTPALADLPLSKVDLDAQNATEEDEGADGESESAPAKPKRRRTRKSKPKASEGSAEEGDASHSADSSAKE